MRYTVEPSGNIEIAADGTLDLLGGFFDSSSNFVGTTISSGTLGLFNLTFALRLAPSISSNGIVNGASFELGPIAPGSIASVFGHPFWSVGRRSRVHCTRNFQVGFKLAWRDGKPRRHSSPDLLCKRHPNQCAGTGGAGGALNRDRSCKRKWSVVLARDGQRRACGTRCFQPHKVKSNRRLQFTRTERWLIQGPRRR